MTKQEQLVESIKQLNFEYEEAKAQQENLYKQLKDAKRELKRLQDETLEDYLS